MKFITGTDRNQIHFFAYQDLISSDNDVRTIDLFVDALDLQACGFDMNFVDNGRPAYHPSDLLKLFLYGYLNRIRSSRTLEKESYRNIEVLWLLKNLHPDHNTIANFRRDNAKAIRRVFRTTVKVAQHFELIGGKLLAGDGTRVRAQNSKKNNFNEKKIDRHLEYIDNKLQQYNDILAAEDGDKPTEEEKKVIDDKIKAHQVQKNKYQDLKQQLAHSGDTQISTSDPQSRQIMMRNNIAEVCYNIQTTVDEKHNIPIDYKVTNVNDSKAMGNMVRRAKTILDKKDFTILYDKGYHTGSEFTYAEKLGIDTLVAIPAVAAHAPDTNYDIQHFKYNTTDDIYTCPEGNTLSSNGKWYNKDRTASTVKVKHYKSPLCISCPAFEKCTKNKKGRLLERSQHQDAIDRNAQRISQNKDTYKRRQAIVEHPFGIIKRQWGFDHIMTKKSIQRASSDIGLVFCAYNLRRIFNILDNNSLKAYLKALNIIFHLYTTLIKPKCKVVNFSSENNNIEKYLHIAA